MDGSTAPSTTAPSFRSPPRLLIPKLVASRDKWKAKAGRRKTDLKKAQIRARDVSASRDRWKRRALAAEQRLQDARQQLEHAQRQLEQTRADVAVLQDEAKKNGPPPTP
jgi:chromosome segregation ATPase